MVKRKKQFAISSLPVQLYNPFGSQLNVFFSGSITFPTLTPQTAIFGLISSENNNSNILILYHLLLVFKLYIYKARERHSIRLDDVIVEIDKVRKMEKRLAALSEVKTIQYNKELAKYKEKTWRISFNLISGKNTTLFILLLI